MADLLVQTRKKAINVEKELKARLWTDDKMLQVLYAIAVHRSNATKESILNYMVDVFMATFHRNTPRNEFVLNIPRLLSNCKKGVKNYVNKEIPDKCTVTDIRMKLWNVLDFIETTHEQRTVPLTPAEKTCDLDLFRHAFPEQIDPTFQWSLSPPETMERMDKEYDWEEFLCDYLDGKPEHYTPKVEVLVKDILLGFKTNVDQIKTCANRVVSSSSSSSSTNILPIVSVVDAASD